ncbi:MAG: hypothetical protein ABIS36_20915 [Chryseolinea sp.]
MQDNATDALQLIAGLVAFCAYIPLTFAILRNTASQSFAAFLLWGMLDGIAMVGLIFQGGNFWLPLSNVLGTATIASLLVIKKQVDWTWIETLTSTLVLICMIIWFFTGDTGAIVSSSIALVIASIPQMVDTYRRPKETPVLVYMIWLIANLLSFLAGKEWTIKERFYPACGMILCLCIIGAGLMQRTPRKSV